MRVNSDERTVISGGLGGSSQFGISEPDQAHIISLLRDQIYSDKVLAVLREYGANARDANVLAGRADVPIEVTLPTREDPVLRIRDRGPGLSRDEVMNVYTQYGASSKRDSDDYVGMLGIGSKSAFAYADTFTITSFHGGVRSEYVAVIDESQKGAISLLHEELLESDDDTGLEISIAVKLGDIDEFTEKARQLYRHFTPRPVINTELPSLGPGDISLPGGVIMEGYEAGTHNHAWYAVMGCVPYRINLAQIAGVPAFTRHASGFLYVPIGDVHVAASREELKYSDRTKAGIGAAFDELAAQYAKWALSAISDATLSNWERRRRIMGFSRMGLPVPKAYSELSQTSVRVIPADLNGVTVPFSIRSTSYDRVLSSNETSLYLTRETRILLKDDKRTVKGYSLKHHDYVVIPHKDYTIQFVRKRLGEMLEASKLDGIPIVLMSTMPWSPVARRGGSVQRHGSKRAFRLIAANGFTAPYSEGWEPVDRKETPSDVYVDIEHFSNSYLFENYATDRLACQMLGEQMPTVFGYKKRKGVADKHLGTDYKSWSLKLNERLVSDPTVKGRVERYALYRMYMIEQWSHSTEHPPELPGDHPVRKLYDDIVAVNDEFSKIDKMGFRTLETRFPSIRDTVKKRVRAVMGRYPLFFDEPMKLMNSDRRVVQLYVDYVKIVDSVREADAGTVIHDNERPDHPLVGGEDEDGEVGRPELPSAA